MKRVFLSLLAMTALLSSGCLFSRKSRQPKETGAIATDVEREFKQRWLARRVSELSTQGVTGPAAQQQAEQEFVQKFTFAEPARK